MQGTRNERQASMVEYWLVIAVITVISLLALSAAGVGIREEFVAVSDGLGGTGRAADDSPRSMPTPPPCEEARGDRRGPRAADSLC